MFVELSRRALKITDGNPRALIMVGSYLHGESVEVWEATINRLEKAFNGDDVKKERT